jgi:hypothetical protein
MIILASFLVVGLDTETCCGGERVQLQGEWEGVDASVASVLLRDS